MASGRSDLVVRAIETEAEIVAYHHVMAATFSSAGDVASAAQRGRQFVESLPEFHPHQRRGAFRGETYLGGYIIYERWLRVGPSRLLTGCIGGVAVDPQYRNQSVATALMNEALSFAKAQRHALILLDGIPNFYHRFGYADVVDLTDQLIDRKVVQSHSGPAAVVRTATLEDATALLELFDRHYGPHTGSFARSLEQQEGRIRRSLEANRPPVLAIDDAGIVRGYLLPRGGNHPERAAEVAADTWTAVLALLRHHDQLAEAAAEASPLLRWPLPPGSPTHLLLTDQLTAPESWEGDGPARRWSIRGETYQRPSAGWMARVASFPDLIRSLLLIWQARLATALLGWQGSFILRVNGESQAIELIDRNLRVIADAPAGAPVAELSGERLVQAVFGYRPMSFLATRPGSSIPEELMPVLQALFPAGQPWIPGSDGF